MKAPLRRLALALPCVLSATASFAACSNTPPVSKEMKESDAVIVGTVMSSSPVPQSWDALDGTNYVVRIDQKVKGKHTGELTVFSERRDDGFDMKAGTQYLLFLSDVYRHWMVNTCGNSGPMDEEGRVIKQLARAIGND
jgi:hypothetical protein